MWLGTVVPNFQSVANLQGIPLLLRYLAAGVDFIASGRRKTVVQMIIAAAVRCRLKMLFGDLADSLPVILLYATMVGIDSPGTCQKQASYGKRDQSPKDTGK